jgi:hypothetical protein
MDLAILNSIMDLNFVEDKTKKTTNLDEFLKS